MKPGTVIVLNGTSSSGKSSLLRALQTELTDPYLDAGLDKFLWMLPPRYLAAPLWSEVMGEANRAGVVGDRLVRGLHAAVAELSKVGNNVIVDHVLVEPAWVEHLAKVLAGLPTLFVGLFCPLPTLEERERARADRTLGQARLQFDLVHQGACYDLVVNMSVLSAQHAAKEVAAHLAHSGPNYAFNTGHFSAA